MKISESILQAVDTIVSEKLNQLHFDITETCVVIGLEDEIKNTYRVRHNNVAFSVKTIDNTVYESDDYVSVLIPKGDWNSPDKVIMGKVASLHQKERKWTNPLDRMMPYVSLRADNGFEYTAESEGYADGEDYSAKIFIDTDPKIWEQFINISQMSIFDFIGLSANVYSYLGNLPESKLPTEQSRFWIEVQLCGEDNASLYTLVEDQVSPLLFTSNNIDGDPFSQTIKNNRQQILWHFPNNENVDLTKVRKICLIFNCNDIHLDQNLEGEKIGIYIDNIELSFGYDLAKYQDEGIILSIPKDFQTLYDNGYADVTEKTPEITAWVMRPDKQGLLEESEVKGISSSLFKAVNEINTNLIKILPRYIDYDLEGINTDQRGWFLNKKGTSIKDNSLVNDTYYPPDDTVKIWRCNRLNVIKAWLFDENGFADLYIPNKTVRGQIESVFSNMEKYASEIIANYQDLEDDKALTENETKNLIQNFFVQYEKLINLMLSSIDTDYELRWYQYQFGATENKHHTDNFGGAYWVPIADDESSEEQFKYYLNTKLPGEKYSFKTTAETLIKAVLCQQGYKNNIIDQGEGDQKYRIYQTEYAPQKKIYDTIIKFTNANFSRIEKEVNDYLIISGQNFLNIYDGNNALWTGFLPSNWNKVSVDFKDEHVQANMNLIPNKSIVVWELINKNANQIKTLITDGVDNWRRESLNYWRTLLGTSEELNYTMSWDNIINEITPDLEDMAWDETLVVNLENLINYLRKIWYVVPEQKNEQYKTMNIWDELFNKLITAASKIQANEEREEAEKEIRNTLLPTLWNKLQELQTLLNDDITHIATFYSTTSEYWKHMRYMPMSEFDISNNQSAIRCSIDDFFTDFYITFSWFNTQGTNYSFTIVPDELPYIGIKNKVDETLTYKFRAVLRNATQGNEITDLEAYNLRWSWKDTTYTSYPIIVDNEGEYTNENEIKYSRVEADDEGNSCYIKENGKQYTITQQSYFGPINNSDNANVAELQLQVAFPTNAWEFSQVNAIATPDSEKEPMGSGTLTCTPPPAWPNTHILQATCEVPVAFDEEHTEIITLMAYYPIAICDPDTEIDNVNGVFHLGWNERGILITPSRNIKGVIGNIQYELSPSPEGMVVWKLLAPNENIELSVNDEVHLVLSNTNINLPNYPIVVNASVSEQMIYQVPLFTSINQYSVDATNKWSGTGITLDEDNGVILTTQIGAGSKDNTNKFSGVIMGDVQLSDGTVQTGLYGFGKDGISTFGIDATTGDAYFKGRIDALGGSLGGWEIGSDGIYYDSQDEDEKRYKLKLSHGGDYSEVVFHVGYAHDFGLQIFADGNLKCNTLFQNGDDLRSTSDVGSNLRIENGNIRLYSQNQRQEGSFNWYFKTGTDSSYTQSTYTAGLYYRGPRTNDVAGYFQAGIKAEGCTEYGDAIFYIVEYTANNPSTSDMQKFFYVQRNGLIYTKTGITSDGAIFANNYLQIGYGGCLQAFTNEKNTSVIGLIGYGKDGNVWAGDGATPLMLLGSSITLKSGNVTLKSGNVIVGDRGGIIVLNGGTLYIQEVEIDLNKFATDYQKKL